ncbi:unnamed protein product [Calypogeia fissa]
MASATAALRVSCTTTTTNVLHRACILSSFHSLASSLVRRRSDTWRATKLCGVLRTVEKSRLLQNSGRMSSSETPRCFSDGVDAELTLAKKKCTPCSSKDLQAMTSEAAKELLEQIPGWELLEIDGKLQLQRSWKAKNFMKGLEFIKTIADVAESEGHHPDLHLVNWNDVKANIWTHAVGGLTENDFILAAKISALSSEGYLRKKPSPKPPIVAI